MTTKHSEAQQTAFYLSQISDDQKPGIYGRIVSTLLSAALEGEIDRVTLRRAVEAEILGPTCSACGRPEDDCSEDPCPSVIADRGDWSIDVRANEEQPQIFDIGVFQFGENTGVIRYSKEDLVTFIDEAFKVLVSQHPRPDVVEFLSGLADEIGNVTVTDHGPEEEPQITSDLCRHCHLEIEGPYELGCWYDRGGNTFCAHSNDDAVVRHTP